ncbi:alpha/beta hydrolase family protein [Pulveribacter suum]|uniref:Alpha/beta hydrolase n=1 Tax=Pulveribacter suum TaxID=2116657 RepID=A0A2P1NP54_9BURK|nr:alpha/beta fold hydrolase [Pulveribacter suum]AVP58832.1 alpha/beta hydrolase [Pulveribacter suum]
MQQLTLAADGGASLALRRYAPLAGVSPRGSVVIGGAFGVPQSFYGPFAQWLAGQGWAVTTFDYRGQGASLHGPLRGVQADLAAWARDYDAVIAHAAQALPGHPLYLVGHSLGAQLPGLLREHPRVDGLLSVAAGSGYWRENAPRIRLAMPFFWHVLVPLSVRLCGYFPGKRLRAVGDLPAGVALQWRRWCLHPRYSVGAEGAPAQSSYEAVRFPIHAWSMTDDELMTLAGTESLLALYAHAPRQIERIAPQDGRAPRIGHFGFFRDRFARTLWPRAAQQLAQFGAARVAGTTAA